LELLGTHPILHVSRIRVKGKEANMAGKKSEQLNNLIKQKDPIKIWATFKNIWRKLLNTETMNADILF